MIVQSIKSGQEYNIEPNSRGRSICPVCSHQRRKSSERCLAWNESDGVGYCHHCGESFKSSEARQPGSPSHRAGVPDVIPRSNAIRKIKDGRFLKNDFARGLMRLFDLDEVSRVLNKYGVGSSWEENVIFYQHDINGDIRTGKEIKYDPVTLKRDRFFPPFLIHKKIKSD